MMSTEVLDGTQAAALIFSACGFMVAALRMALMRPMWTTGAGPYVWYAFAGLCAWMVLVSLRDLWVLERLGTVTPAGVMIRAGKMTCVVVLLITLFWRGKGHAPTND